MSQPSNVRLCALKARSSTQRPKSARPNALRTPPTIPHQDNANPYQNHQHANRTQHGIHNLIAVSAIVALYQMALIVHLCPLLIRHAVCPLPIGMMLLANVRVVLGIGPTIRLLLSNVCSHVLLAMYGIIALSLAVLSNAPMTNLSSILVPANARHAHRIQLGHRMKESAKE